MVQNKSLKTNALLNTFNTFLLLFFPLITFPYSSRILGPENLGKVNFANSIVSYFSIIASLGIGTYAIREVSKVRNEPEQMNQVCREIFTINVISTLISYALLAVSLLFVKKFQYYRELIIICSSLIFFNTIGMSWLIKAMEDYLYITVRSIGFQILSVIMLFTLVKTKDDYLWYAAINIISNVGANVFNFFHSRKYISFKSVTILNYKRHLKPIIILFSSAIANTIFASIDTSMLGFMSSDREVGFYSAGLKIVKMVQHLFPAIVAVIFPRLSYYVAKKDVDSISELSGKTMNFLMCLSFPITVGIIILIEPLVLLFCGQTYFDAVVVTKIMSPHIFITAISGFLGAGLIIAMGKEKIYLFSIVSASLIDVVLNYLFIPKYNAFGAGAATLITELYVLVFDCIYLQKFLKSLSIVKNLVDFVIATVIMGFLIRIMQGYISNAIVKLVVCSFFGMVIYGAVLFLLRDKFFISQGKAIWMKVTVRKKKRE